MINNPLLMLKRLKTHQKLLHYVCVSWNVLFSEQIKCCITTLLSCTAKHGVGELLDGVLP